MRLIWGLWIYSHAHLDIRFYHLMNVKHNICFTGILIFFSRGSHHIQSCVVAKNKHTSPVIWSLFMSIVVKTLLFSMACGGAILKQAHFIFTEWYAMAITYMCVCVCVCLCGCVFFFLSVVRNRLEMLHCSTESFLLGPQGVWPTPRNQNYRGEDSERGGGRECRTSGFEKYNLAPSNILNSWKTQSDSAENRPPSSQVRESLDSRANKTNLCVTVCSLCLLRGHFAGRGHDSLPLCLAGLGEPITVQSWKPTRPPTVTQSWGRRIPKSSGVCY